MCLSKICKPQQGLRMKKKGPARFGLVLVLSLLLASLSFSGCATQQPTTDVSDTENMTASEKIEFFDAGTFDRKLSSKLRKDPQEVTIDFLADANVNDMPERMDKWFAAVEKGEGVIDVEVDPDYRTRGIISEVIALVIGAYEFVKDKWIYSPAQNYNVTVYYIQGTGEITRVIFTHK